MQDPNVTVISQYANSPTILQLIASFNEWIDPAANFDAFYDLIWNLETAAGEGLSIWGRIVGVTRVLTFPAAPDYFGFQDGVGDYNPFNSAPFYDGTIVTQNFTLSDEAFRTLIFIKAAANIAAAASPTLNRLLTALFAGRGRVYVNSLGYMQMRYTFEFYLQPFEQAILLHSGVIPSPTGVQVYVLQVPTGSTFGFAEAGPGVAPFGQGTFLRNGADLASQTVTVV